MDLFRACFLRDRVSNGAEIGKAPECPTCRECYTFLKGKISEGEELMICYECSSVDHSVGACVLDA